MVLPLVDTLSLLSVKVKGYFTFFCIRSLLLFRSGGMKHKAVHCGVGDQDAEIVADLNLMQCSRPALLHCRGVGNQGLPFRGAQIGDVAVEGDGGILGVTIGGHGGGKVREGEDGATHDRAAGVEMLGQNRHNADGFPRLCAFNGDLRCFRCKAVVAKELTDGFYMGHKHLP